MITVANIKDLPSFGKKTISVEGVEILLVNIKGKIYAVENSCPHQGISLSAAIVKDDYISCPRHGYKFNLSDGQCIGRPEFKLKTYPVTVDGDNILVDPA